MSIGTTDIHTASVSTANNLDQLFTRADSTSVE
jgi:hypothetical protein